MFFTLSLQGGGAERVIASLSNEMAKKNDITIVTVHNNEDYYNLDRSIRRIRIDKKTQDSKSGMKKIIEKLSIKRIWNLARIIDSESPDVVITFLPLPSLYIMIAKRLNKKIKKTPVILSERADPNKEYQNKLVFVAMKKLFKNADGFVFQTEEAKKFYDGIIECKTAIIENPINESFLGHKIPRIRRKVIVSCGRLEAQKNYKLLIGAFSEISRELPEYTLEIYGEGNQKDELLKYADELEIKKKVFFKGRVNDLANKIADAGVFVLSSDYEGMPNALMEAMALGIPCISTDCPVGGPRALIKNGWNGILIDVNNRRQLSNAIMEVLTDTNVSSAISKHGIISSNNYSVEKIAKKWRTFMQSVLRNNE